MSDFLNQPEDVSEDRPSPAHDESKPEEQPVEPEVSEAAAEEASVAPDQESVSDVEPEAEAIDVKSEGVEQSSEETLEAPVAEESAPEEPEAAPEVVDSTPAPATEEPEEAAEDQEPAKSDKMEWYIIKVQSNREDTIRAAVVRRVAIAGLDQYFGQIIVPVQEEKELKGGKERIVRKKILPGYVVIQMEVNDETRLLIRETPGVGDFLGSEGTAIPLPPHEVERILQTEKDEREAAPKLKIGFKVGDQVKINDGPFANHEGEVDTVDETSGHVVVMVNIFGRSTPVELEYWQIEAV